MSWWSDFTGKPIGQAQAAANDVIQRVDPILTHVVHAFFGGLHGVITRLNGTKVTMTFEIPPQPYPDETSEIRKGEKVG